SGPRTHRASRPFGRGRNGNTRTPVVVSSFARHCLFLGMRVASTSVSPRQKGDLGALFHNRAQGSSGDKRKTLVGPRKRHACTRHLTSISCPLAYGYG